MKYFTITIIYIFTTSFVSIEALFSLPGISWGWGGAENVTKVITSPEVLARYPLPFPYRQCSAGMEGIMTRLFVHPCSGEKYGRCQLTRGENVTLDLEFVSNIPLHSLVGSLNAIFTRWFSPLALGEPEDLCKSEFITCPIQPFHPFRYRTSIFIPPTLPALSPDIKVLIKGENVREIACGIVPVSVIGLERGSLPISTYYPKLVMQ